MSDNQTYRVKVIKNMLRDIYYNIRYIVYQPLEVGGGTAYIKKKLASSEPFMICRLGAKESRTAVRWMKTIPYEQRNSTILCIMLEFFQMTKKQLMNFVEYTQVL